MNIRPAETSDAEQLSAIAQAAKSYWNYPAEWLEIWRPQLTISPEIIRHSQVFVLSEEIGSEPIGFYVLHLDPPAAQLEHLWIVPARIGSGCGKLLFRHAETLAEQFGCTAIDIDAEPNAEDFYKKMGAVTIGHTESTLAGTIRRLPQMRLLLRD